MRSDCQVVDGRTNLQQFVDESLLRTGGRCFLVTEENILVGLLTPHEIKEVPRARWTEVTISEVMRPLNKLQTIGPNTPLSEALERMARDDVNQLPVVSGSRIAGVLSRGNIMQLLRTRAELEV